MDRRWATEAHDNVVKSFCVGALLVILIAGLWPFHAPLNNVKWLVDEDGLEFGHHGSIVTSGAFQSRDPDRDDSGSLEVWILPSPVMYRHTILAFDGPGTKEVPFRLQQDGRTLIVQRHNVDLLGTNRIGEFRVDHAFPDAGRVFVAVTFNKHETSVYLDGALVKTAPSLGTSTANFTGRLVLGNAPSASDSWPGQILGLAIFRDRLTPSRVAEYYESWRQHRQQPMLPADQLAALYLFSEHEGRLIHNRVDAATNLTIPLHYFVLHPEFLTPPWRDFNNSWSYWTDVAVNIGGFVPFGFFIFAYFSSVRASGNPAAITIAFGFLTSLTIEVAQAFLPTRDSGMNDLITNTLGTALGVWLCRGPQIQPMLSGLSCWITSLHHKMVEDIEGSQI